MLAKSLGGMYVPGPGVPLNEEFRALPFNFLGYLNLVLSGDLKLLEMNFISLFCVMQSTSR